MEYIDIVDENNQLTGEVKEKKQAHQDKNYHRTAHIWILNDKKELLIQKRSKDKSSWPSYWDISAAGHIRSGETTRQGGIRELKEELGVMAKESDLLYIGTIKIVQTNPDNLEFADIYLLECDKKEDEYCFEDQEVEEVKYLFYEEFDRMRKNGELNIVPLQEEHDMLVNYIKNME